MLLTLAFLLFPKDELPTPEAAKVVAVTPTSPPNPTSLPAVAPSVSQPQIAIGSVVNPAPVQKTTAPSTRGSPPARGRSPTAAPAPPVVAAAPSAAPEATGTLKFNSVPWSNVTVDGTSAGVTPFNRAIAAGSHTIVLQTSAGETTRHTLKVAAGAVTNWCWEFELAAECR